MAAIRNRHGARTPGRSPHPRIRTSRHVRNLGRHPRPGQGPGSRQRGRGTGSGHLHPGRATGIAAVAASLEHVDALVFTGEIGEDQTEVREAVAAGLGVLGVEGGLSSADPENPRVVSRPGAAVPVVVVPTGESTQIARETRACLHTRH
ncbi:hypothetical protein [Streptomyces erythrochromogenes]|uniref:hypothetical protein n=1 Tax=Streptomyces erythrochromogenes TaxID=285574 RepID=UPI00386BD3B7|nr:hypothetical protein OG364_38450 [Streptomyces erythrochromogenes]